MIGVTGVDRLIQDRLGAFEPNPAGMQMLEALNIRAMFSGQHIYAGTVPAHVIKRRRAKDKAAKAARKIARRNK